MFGHDDDQNQTDDQNPTDDNQTDDTNDANTPVPAFGAPAINDAGSYEETPAPASDPGTATSSPQDDNLLDIKRQALQQLSPLLGHLNQTPEEKFKTTMMMIQAADNKELVKTAYEAAEQINDEKSKAQALLDVINEINYFIQPPKDNESAD